MAEHATVWEPLALGPQESALGDLQAEAELRLTSKHGEELLLIVHRLVTFVCEAAASGTVGLVACIPALMMTVA